MISEHDTAGGPGHYVGNDPFLRWYQDNGTGWFDAIRFDPRNRELQFLAWTEAVDGVGYRVLLDRRDREDSLRLVVDLGDLVEDRVLVTPMAPCAGRSTGPETTHHCGGWAAKGYFFLVGRCARIAPSHTTRRLAIAASFFTGHRMTEARALAVQVITYAKKGLTVPKALEPGNSGFYTNCEAAPWR